MRASAIHESASPLLDKTSAINEQTSAINEQNRDPDERDEESNIEEKPDDEVDEGSDIIQSSDDENNLPPPQIFETQIDSTKTSNQTPTLTRQVTLPQFETVNTEQREIFIQNLEQSSNDRSNTQRSTPEMIPELKRPPVSNYIQLT